MAESMEPEPEPQFRLLVHTPHFFWNQIPNEEFKCGATLAGGNSSKNCVSADAANVGLPAHSAEGKLHEHADARGWSVPPANRYNE